MVRRSCPRPGSRALFLATSLILWSNVTPRTEARELPAVDFEESADAVEVHDFLEVTLRVPNPTSRNPFTDVAVRGEFRRDGGEAKAVDGFCDSQDGSVFRIRFLPESPGRYTYRVTYVEGGEEARHEGRFSAVKSRRKGLLRVDPDHPWHFLWTGTGEHYFWNGTTTYYLMGWEDVDEIRRIIDRLADLKVNRLRVLLYGRNQDRPWGQPVRSTEAFKLYLNPWVAQRPEDVKDPGFDLGRFQVSHWRKYEAVLRHAREKDIIVSVIFFIGGQEYPTPPAAYSEDEKRFYRYGVARFAAFSNVTWDLGNEHDFHREVPKWCNWLGSLVKEWDPYDHLLSAHNVVYRGEGSDWIDMQLIQRWDAGQNAFLLEERQKQRGSGRIVPQVNEEYGYEDLWEKSPGQRRAETRRLAAWEIYMAGAYQTTGETANRGTGFAPDTGGGWVNGRGDDSMTLLSGYAPMVEFFTSFDWWRLEPRNDLAEGGALCLADEGQTYALYSVTGDPVAVRLEPGTYRSRAFDPLEGRWTSLPVARGPVWTSPPSPFSRDGDWALLLQSDPDARDETPPAVVSVTASVDSQEVRVAFSEQVELETAEDLEHYRIRPAVTILGARVEGPLEHVVVLKARGLEADVEYSLEISRVRDRAASPNTMETAARATFRAFSTRSPLVELRFEEGAGQLVTNTGRTAETHARATLTKPRPVWSSATPPGGGASSVDFGSETGPFAVDLAGGPVSELEGLRSFTVCGWVNCRDAKAGSGGNRIVTWIRHGGEGVDVVFLQDGRLQVGINQWPDGVPATSSPGRIPVDPEAKRANWRFFAVTYDSTSRRDHVRFYFGSASAPAELDSAVSYDRGAVGQRTGPLAVGHFNELTRGGASDRQFRGLIDEVRVYGSSLDARGALPLEVLREIQRGR